MNKKVKNIFKKALPPLITVIIISFILSRINLQSLYFHFSTMNIFILLVSLLLFVPITLIKSERWRYIIREYCKISSKKALKITFLGASFMVITPSQLGDMVKADFLKREGSMPLRRGVPSIFFEKALDLMALCILCIVGILLVGLTTILVTILAGAAAIVFAFIFMYVVVLSKSRILRRIMNIFFRIKHIGEFVKEAYNFMLQTKSMNKLLGYILLSVFLWAVHLLQIYLFFLAFGFYPSTELVLALVPPAILTGLLPITIAGIGTRDSMLLLLFGEYAPTIPTAAVMGVAVFCSIRYLIPAIPGTLFLKEYIRKF
ncbi:MAG: lysylphosphatidylglycerol synthase transmembrane domain-containing protein [Candidatus Aenigmatarchaeota archaeon]